MARPVVFIASSTEAIPIAESVEECIADVAKPVLWSSAINAGRLLLEVILEHARTADFGIFVVSPDDRLRTRGQDLLTVRDNVLFEAGVFMGALGADRTFLLWPRGRSHRLRIPSDLLGLIGVLYGPKRGRTWNLSADLKSTRTLIASMGPAFRTGYNEIEVLRTALDEAEIEIVGGRPESILEIVAPAAAARARPWFVGTDVEILLKGIGRRYKNGVVDEVFWWLIVNGVITFNNIETWSDSYKEWRWQDSMDYVVFSTRGIALLNDLRARPARVRARVGATRLKKHRL